MPLIIICTGMTIVVCEIREDDSTKVHPAKVSHSNTLFTKALVILYTYVTEPTKINHLVA